MFSMTLLTGSVPFSYSGIQNPEEQDQVAVDLNIFDEFGSSVTDIGDINHDGINDLAVGAMGDDDGGYNTGAVWILFLNKDGTVNHTQKISSINDVFSPNINNEDFFGSSVTDIGDINHDGINDLAVGAMGDDDGGYNTGAVWILFLNKDGTVNHTQKISSIEGKLNYPLVDDSGFGSSISNTGDLDGDGINDLAVVTKSSSDNKNMISNSGFWILFLNKDGTVKSTTAVFDTPEAYTDILLNDNGFGSSITQIGDLDGDGISELVVGAKGNSYGTNGSLWVLFLKQDGNIRSFYNLTYGINGFDENSDELNWPVSYVGDLDGNGVNDMMIGFPDTNTVIVLLLDLDGKVLKNQKISMTDGGFNGIIHTRDNFGSSLASIGDLDGDGIPDFIIGAKGDNDGDGINTGAIWILFMHKDGTVRLAKKISQTEGNFIGNIGMGNNFGSSIFNIGDVDGDKITDIVVSTKDPNISWLLLLNPSGVVKSTQKITHFKENHYGVNIENINKNKLHITAKGDHDGNGITDLVINKDGNHFGVLFMNKNGTADSFKNISDLRDLGKFGWVVTNLGDLNKDGTNDLAVGSPSYNTVWILFMNQFGFVDTFHKISENSRQFGASVTNIGDLNKDGTNDLAVGMKTYPFWDYYQEPFWIFLLNEDGTVKSKQVISFPSIKFNKDITNLGDLNKDGTNDLAVGVMIYHPPKSLYGGCNSSDPSQAKNCKARQPTVEYSIMTLFMNEDGTVKSKQVISTNDAKFSDQSVSNAFGHSIANIGDFDGDEIIDLAVTDYKQNTIWILFLNSDGTLKHYKKIIPGIDGFDIILNKDDMFGISISNAGDIDGDGISDLMIGASGDDDSNYYESLNSGALYTVFLNKDATVKSFQKISNMDGEFGYKIKQKLFAKSVTNVGDLNKDGTNDLAVGSPELNTIWILFSNFDGTVKSFQKISKETKYLVDDLRTVMTLEMPFDCIYCLSVKNEEQQNSSIHKQQNVKQINFNNFIKSENLFGKSLQGLGDINNDGLLELLVGSNTRHLGGKVWMLSLDQNGIVKMMQDIYPDSVNFSNYDQNDEFGSSFTYISDLDGNSVNEIIIGAKKDDQTGINKGALWVLFPNQDLTMNDTSTQKIFDIRKQKFLDNKIIVDHNNEVITVKGQVGSHYIKNEPVMLKIFSSDDVLIQVDQFTINPDDELTFSKTYEIDESLFETETTYTVTVAYGQQQYIIKFDYKYDLKKFENIQNTPNKNEQPVRIIPSKNTIKIIQCQNELELVFKSSNSNSYCVKHETAQKLIERGWKTTK